MRAKTYGPINQNAFIVPDIDAGIDHWTSVMGVGPFFKFPKIEFVKGDYRGKSSLPEFDAAIAYVASNVSLPIFAPFINITEIEVGAYLRTGSLIHLDRADFDARGPLDYARELALGTLVVSPVSAAVAAGLTYAVGWISRRRRGTSANVAKA